MTQRKLSAGREDSVDLFGIGFGEVILVLVVALVIFGPGRIVEIGLKLGKTARALRKVTYDLTAQVTKELENAVEDKSRQAAEDKPPVEPKGSTKNEN